MERRELGGVGRSWEELGGGGGDRVEGFVFLFEVCKFWDRFGIVLG